MLPSELEILNNPLVLNLFCSIVGGIAVAIIIVLCKPVLTSLIGIRDWLMFSIRNPKVSPVIVVSGNIEPTSAQQFEVKIRRVLEATTDPQVIRRSGDIYKSSKQFGNYRTDVEVSPVLDRSHTHYTYFSIMLRVQEVNVRGLKEKLAEVQTFLFRDIITAIHSEFRFKPVIEKESITIKFDTKPKMLREVKELNIQSLKSKEDNVEIVISDEQMKITGGITNAYFEKIEKLIRANTVS